MKRLGLFSAILLSMIFVFYMQPVFFPAGFEKKKSLEQQPQSQMTMWKYQTLQATGFSAYIGQSIGELERRFGQPYEQLASGFGFETRYYKDQINQLSFEANIESGQVSTIKVLQADQTNIAPFSFGMTLQDLTEITTIYTNFSFQYHEAEFGIELMEEDMNYRPLIAFNNGTFAILFFDQSNSGLFSLVYLNKENLLKLHPYQVFGEDLPQYKMEKQVNWSEIDHAKAKHSYQLLNQFRQLDGLAFYKQMPAFSIQTTLLLTDFLRYPGEILSKERLAEWQQINGSSKTTAKFSLTTDELNALVAKRNLSKVNGVFSHPIIDPTFTFLLLYSDPYYHDRFLRNTSDLLGIAFSKENMLVLLQEEVKESTDSSED
ncbi:CAP-associated domain-containing protein [Enterococcus ratti]|uniref:CAP-associated domain-containing protein n=1 Tax=Enterococcus ratti TaxID=150033 RepID=A0A1L8WB69_9ENTE|nr:CAP-associated domain-containing protein [Enterococcus ratti]OJG78259.1 hypothetical protein RV14_GL001200 [Enterococcus ratti]